MVGATVGLDDLLKAQAEERSEDWAGRLIKGASWREGRKAEPADAATDESRRLGLK